MKNKNYWNLAISISLIAHFAILMGLYPIVNINLPLNKEKPIKEIKIIVKEIIKKDLPKGTGGLERGSESNSLPPPPYVKNIMRKLIVTDDKRLSLDKPKLFEKDINEIVIYDKLDNAALKRNPSYMTYYNTLRSKLYEISRKTYNGKTTGEVSLSFALLRDGSLEYVKGEGNSQQLIDLAVRIVKESAPFSSFPEELKGQSCHFGISILFKNN